jgi:dipeptidyl aminopeptidase/acylaminoacyl peptidase
VLLCLVQGLSREEAARRLGWSGGSVKGLLERGRKKLAARLAARGLAPAVALAPVAATALPADLLARTAELAADPRSKAIPVGIAALAAAGRPRAALPVALAGVALAAGLAGWALALGPPKPAEPPAAPPAVKVVTNTATAQPTPDEPLPDGAARRFGTPWFRHPSAIEGLAVSPDAVFAVAFSGGRMDAATRAYDLATGRPRFAIPDEPGGRFVEGVAVSPDGNTVAVKRAETVFLHAAATGKEFGRIATPAANPRATTDLLTFSPDGKRIAVASAEGKAVHLLDVAKGEVARTLEHTHVVFAAAFAPDGKALVAGGYDSEKGAYFARVWDVEGGKELRHLAFGSGGIRSIAYSPDGKTVAVAGDGGRTLEVKLFDAATAKELRTVAFPNASSVKFVAFSPDGKTLAASGGAALRLFAAATGQEVLKISGKAIGLRFSPDGKVLVGAVAGTVYKWDAATGRPLIPKAAPARWRRWRW